MELVLSEIETNSRLDDEKTDPAAVFLAGKPSEKLKRLSRKALWALVSADEAIHVAKETNAVAVAYGSSLGLVGALAAIGESLQGDHTYELVAYRKKQRWGTRRKVDENSVKVMDRLTAPWTFNNYDFENRRMLVTPHGPDPVLFGIRGETPASVLRAFRLLKVMEPVERWVIFRTNHGTDAHVKAFSKKVGPKPYSSVRLTGVVAGRPITIRGGHCFFNLDWDGVPIRCAAFEPTGSLSRAVQQLMPGDKVAVHGGIKGQTSRRLTVNLERLEILKLADHVMLRNPRCPQCGHRMKSAGKRQGFKCENCSTKLAAGMKERVFGRRRISVGVYLPSLKAHRHLTKPMQRFGLEKSRWIPHRPYGLWHQP